MLQEAYKDHIPDAGTLQSPWVQPLKLLASGVTQVVPSSEALATWTSRNKLATLGPRNDAQKGLDGTWRKRFEDNCWLTD